MFKQLGCIQVIFNVPLVACCFKTAITEDSSSSGSSSGSGSGSGSGKARVAALLTPQQADSNSIKEGGNKRWSAIAFSTGEDAFGAVSTEQVQDWMKACRVGVRHIYLFSTLSLI